MPPSQSSKRPQSYDQTQEINPIFTKTRFAVEDCHQAQERRRRRHEARRAPWTSQKPDLWTYQRLWGNQDLWTGNVIKPDLALHFSFSNKQWKPPLHYCSPWIFLCGECSATSKAWIVPTSRQFISVLVSEPPRPVSCSVTIISVHALWETIIIRQSHFPKLK